MLPTPQPALAPNTYAYETTPLVKPTGFREYDARWLFGSELNLEGLESVGREELLDWISDRVGQLFDQRQDLADTTLDEITTLLGDAADSRLLSWQGKMKTP